MKQKVGKIYAYLHLSSICKRKLKENVNKEKYKRNPKRNLKEFNGYL